MHDILKDYKWRYMHNVQWLENTLRCLFSYIDRVNKNLFQLSSQQFRKERLIIILLVSILKSQGVAIMYH